MKPKTLVILFGCIQVLLSVVSLVSTVGSGDSDGISPAFVSLLLTCLLVWFLIRGSVIAKWLAVVLNGLGGILLIMIGTSVFAGNPHGLMQLVQGILFLAIAIGLLVPPASRHFRK